MIMLETTLTLTLLSYANKEIANSRRDLDKSLTFSFRLDENA